MGEENPSGYVKRKFRKTHFKLCSKWENQFLLGILSFADSTFRMGKNKNNLKLKKSEKDF